MYITPLAVFELSFHSTYDVTNVALEARALLNSKSVSLAGDLLLCYSFLSVDEAVASRALFVIVSARLRGQARETLLEPAE